MLEERHLVDRLDGLGTGGQRLLVVAVVARHLARLLGGHLVLARDHGAVDLADRPLVPLDREGLAPLEGRPGRVGDDGHAARHLDDVLDARHRPGRRRIDPLDLAARHHRTPLDRRHQHARDLDVHPVHGLTVDLGGDVEARA
jgi:hypothetical protein